MIFGKNLTKEIQEVLQDKNTFAVTDENVMRLYPELFAAERTHILTAGEEQKRFDSVSDICALLISGGADRSAKLVAVGGGVVGDITGFAASCYMRGIEWVGIPTTLLALCDSSIGGKTGLNFKGLKNILGAFHSPKEVYLSSHFVQTLDEREFICGIGEVIKTAALSEELFDLLLKNEKALFEKDEKALEKLIKACAKFKDAIVRQDPYEKKGLRKILNYGHTAGHAFETSDKHRLSHGEYILHGMRIENRLFDDIIDPTFFVQMDKLINTALNGTKTEFDIEASITAAMTDKKNQNDKISVMAIIKPSEYQEHFFAPQEFRRKLHDALK